MRFKKGKTDFFMLFLITVFIVFLLFVVPQFTFLKSNIQKISCQAIRANLQKVIEQYKLENKKNDLVPFKKIDTFMLKQKNYTGKKVLLCPDGGVFKVNSEGKVYCTKHNPELEDN